MEARVVGKTKSAGFQFGIRRTFPVSREEAWAFLLSPEGLRLWLGELASLDLQIKGTYETKEGTTGEIRVAKLHEQLRLTWRKADWDKPSTYQIRLLDAGEGKTTVAFHQEQLSGPHERENAKRRLEAAMAVLSGKFS
ncbi:SRPBCC family protein [Cohnella caldifontis]|uniref:SRPBCC family protein n=1 Tax=Cohnella caldifontis TaxID=3027471 RepID=UPI0023EE0C7D|nr:SRPBCC domain-containing protein [Cohnella sp. YIM B05605]